MLKFIWSPSFAGAPDSDGYRTAQDLLFADAVSGEPLQTFAKADPFALRPANALAARIDTWIGDGKNRVVVMVHGYNFDPTGTVGTVGDDPSGLVYGIPGKTDYHNSWLPLVGDYANDGSEFGTETAIAFAWVSEANFSQYAGAGWDNAYQYAALDLAPLAARALATIIGYLCAKGVTVDILAHSLGTRATSQAIGLLHAGSQDRTIRRVVLLGGAEFCVDANRTLFGRAFEVFNLANREDTVLAIGADQACHPFRAVGTDASAVIGRDGLIANYKWLDIQIDKSEAISWFRARNYNISGFADNKIHPAAFLNHWCYYMNDGNRALVHALLNDFSMTIGWFMQGGFPVGVELPSYGHFNPAIPPTPQSAAERQAMIHPPQHRD